MRWRTVHVIVGAPGLILCLLTDLHLLFGAAAILVVAEVRSRFSAG